MVFLVKLFARGYLFFFLGIARVLLRGGDHIFAAFQRALKKESRCILAFRHPNGGEPQILTWFICFRLKQLAAKAGCRFALRPHALFVYGYEVIRWGGAVARLIMPRLGALPVHHAKLDSRGMTRIYKALTDGPYPLAMAPEGQISYTSESVPRLEEGTVRIGFHTADKLNRGGNSCPVEILPVSIHFRYGKWGKMRLHALINRIERDTGIQKDRKNPLSFTGRLQKARDVILALNEKRYKLSPDERASVPERMDAIMEAALNAAEGILGISRRSGNLINRMNHIRQVCWDRIVIPEIDNMETISRVERSLADLRAGEAWHAGRHMELVDLLWYFRVPPPSEDAPLHEKTEYTQNLWDFANRTMGGTYSTRGHHIYPRRVLIQAGPPINLSSALPVYRLNRKKAIAEAMNALRNAYQACIEEVKKAT